MIYSHPYLISISNTGENALLNPASTLDLLQDCATFHTVTAGASPAVLESEQLAWITNSWNVYFDKPCGFMDQVKISTWPHEFNRVFAHRNFLITNAAGETCLRADSLWILMNMKRQMPIRIKQDVCKQFDVSPRLDMPPMDRHVQLPETMETRKSFPVPRYSLDKNHHVNNVWYVRFGMEYLPEGFQTGHLKVEYTKSAQYGDRIIPQVAQEQRQVWVALCDIEGKPYAKMLFQEKP